MTWIRKRVWQLGIGALLTLIGAWLLYTAGTGDGSQSLLWIGLVVMWIGLAIPLISKVLGTGEDTEEGEGSSG